MQVKVIIYVSLVASKHFESETFYLLEKGVVNKSNISTNLKAD